jgi:hypothetical protein
MATSYKVQYLTQKIRVKDPQYGIVVTKEVSFPTFMSAVGFARTIGNTEDERIIGKPLVEEA